MDRFSRRGGKYTRGTVSPFHAAGCGWLSTREMGKPRLSPGPFSVIPLGLPATPSGRAGQPSRPMLLVNEEAPAFAEASFRDPAGARTQDPNIKSVVLYQLSYRIFRHHRERVLPALGSQK